MNIFITIIPSAIMDALTVLLSVLLSAPVQLFVMFFVYSRWILPAINAMVQTLPAQVREFTEPFIDEKISELQRSVKASSARFQRTVKQACESLDLDEVDLSSDEGIQSAQDQLTKRYGVDIAVQAIGQLIQSIEGRKKAQTNDDKVLSW